MIFTLILLILLTLVICAMILASDSDNERTKRERAEYESRRDNYIAWVRAKYARTFPYGTRYQSRRHIDFTGEHPLSAAELEQVKKEVLR